MAHVALRVVLLAAFLLPGLASAQPTQSHPKPGLWKMTAGLPDEAGNRSISAQICLNAEVKPEDILGARPRLPNANCTTIRTEQTADGRLSETKCEIHGHTVHMIRTIKETETHVESTLVVDTNDGSKLTTKASADWVGSCPSDMKPGQFQPPLRSMGAGPASARLASSGQAVTASQPAQITTPQWTERPTGADFASYYPLRAKQLGKESRVELSCTVSAAGTLTDCTVAEDNPGYGFGDATLRISKLFKMAPQNSHGQPVAGARFKTVIVWKIASTSPPPADGQ